MRQAAVVKVPSVCTSSHLSSKRVLTNVRRTSQERRRSTTAAHGNIYIALLLYLNIAHDVVTLAFLRVQRVLGVGRHNAIRVGVVLHVLFIELGIVAESAAVGLVGVDGARYLHVGERVEFRDGAHLLNGGLASHAGGLHERTVGVRGATRRR